MSKRFHLIVALLAAGALFAGRAASAEDPIGLQSRPGVTVPILYQAADSPVASVILFVGGNGVIAASRGNFLLRVRGRFAQQGISVAVIDAPSDQSVETAGYRSSGEAATDIETVIAFLKQKASAPVWLVGTSNGSISAANGAARLGLSQVAGLILTSAVWEGGMDHVPLGRIETPTLVIHNSGDTCEHSPPSEAEAAVAALTHAPAKQLVWVSSDEIRSDPCQAASPHGYLGIEDQVVSLMVGWIKNHAPAAAP